MIQIANLHREGMRTDLPDFRAGDNIVVNVKVREGNKERIQVFKGVVIQRRSTGVSETVTVRKMSGKIAVERIFPLHSPNVASIIVERQGATRRARIFYLRDRQGKSARIKERK
jgi:large subunit ribosomal protein L19